MDTQVAKYFKRREFACKCGCGFAAVDALVLETLSLMRWYFGAPVTITSACRCAKHNQAENGKPNSYHLKGMAADIKVKGISSAAVADYLELQYPNRFGVIRYDTFTHFDVRPGMYREDKTTKKEASND